MKHFWFWQEATILANPFYSFFMANWSLIRSTLPVGRYARMSPDRFYTPVTALCVFLIQSVFFFAMTVLIDCCRVNCFRCADRRKPKLKQP